MKCAENSHCVWNKGLSPVKIQRGGKTTVGGACAKRRRKNSSNRVSAPWTPTEIFTLKYGTWQIKLKLLTAPAAASVNFYCSVDFPDKHVGGVEADGAGQQPEWQNHQGSVAEVQQGGDELHDVELQTDRDTRNDKTTCRGDWLAQQTLPLTHR